MEKRASYVSCNGVLAVHQVATRIGGPFIRTEFLSPGDQMM